MTSREAVHVICMHMAQRGALMPIEWVEENGVGSRLQEAMVMAVAALNREAANSDNAGESGLQKITK